MPLDNCNCIVIFIYLTTLINIMHGYFTFDVFNKWLPLDSHYCTVKVIYLINRNSHLSFTLIIKWLSLDCHNLSYLFNQYKFPNIQIYENDCHYTLIKIHFNNCFIYLININSHYAMYEMAEIKFWGLDYKLLFLIVKKNCTVVFIYFININSH